jgi:hypothetical protein
MQAEMSPPIRRRLDSQSTYFPFGLSWATNITISGFTYNNAMSTIYSVDSAEVAVYANSLEIASTMLPNNVSNVATSRALLIQYMTSAIVRDTLPCM